MSSPDSAEMEIVNNLINQVNEMLNLKDLFDHSSQSEDGEMN
jgi:hypothetical protein